MKQSRFYRFWLVMTSARVLLSLFLIALVFLVHHFYSKMGFSLAWLQEQRVYVEGLVAQRYALSVAVYILGFVVSVLFGVPVTILLTVAAGYFFGVFWGTFYANIGATLGALVSFLVFRYFLGSFFKGRHWSRFDEFNRSIEYHGHNYLLMMQFLPVTPNFFINVFAGLTNIRLWTFVWTTSVGILPGSLIYTFAGRQLAHVSSLKGLVTAPMIIVLVLLAALACAPILVKRVRSRGR